MVLQARFTALLGVMTLVVGGLSGQASEDGRPAVSRQADAPKWSLNDLVVDPLGDPHDIAPLLTGPQPPGVMAGGDQDFGEIAVLVNDGTLVQNNVTNTLNIISRFYESHGDEYDEVHIHVASTFAGDVDPELGFAFFQLGAGFVGGINRFQGNPLAAEGLTRLTGWTNMNDLPEYPLSPTQDFLGGVASYVEIMGQEFEHAWAAFVQPSANTGADILGRSDAHWSFFLDHAGVGNASPMEGNHWADNGGGSFTTIESFTGLAELDEYLMGLRAPKDMQPFYVIDFPGGKPFDDGVFPQLNVTVLNGSPINLTVQDIIANHGPRGPDTTTSMKSFKAAFILVVPFGQDPSQADLDKINSFRLAWEAYFQTTTEGLGTIDTTLGLGPSVDPSLFTEPDTFEDGIIDLARYEYIQGATISDLGLSPPSGTMSLRLNGNWGGGDEVRSVPIDLSAQKSERVQLNYWFERTGAGDSPEFGESLLVEYYSSFGTWEVLHVFTGSGSDEVVFAPCIEVIPDDGLHDKFRFRFFRRQGSVGEVDDMFIDDISLTIGTSTPGDLDGDGIVGATDLLILLVSWGPCADCDDCIADIDGDCSVGASDLLVLLVNWG